MTVDAEWVDRMRVVVDRMRVVVDRAAVLGATVVAPRMTPEDLAAALDALERADRIEAAAMAFVGEMASQGWDDEPLAEDDPDRRAYDLLLALAQAVDAPGAPPALRAALADPDGDATNEGDT